MLSTGWKDILRPIRDGLGKLLPGKSPPPETPEQRRRRRHADALKGFTYFETFQELDAWQPDQVDPIACSNVPLQTRPAFPHEQEGRAKVLLIHDASGNYQDYESTEGIDLDFEDKYSCRYLHCVETFVYFSHKLVCIPPPTWTNTLHRNGVKSLGTFLVEPQTPGADRILQSMRHCDSNSDSTTFCLASKLAKLAGTYGFDGWLINIEKPFASDMWDRSKLAAFLTQLRQELDPPSQVVWYDALTSSNRVEYQNALTAKNIDFAKAAGSMLANYTWTEAALLDSTSVAQRNGIRLEDVYFGVDVWAQNKQRGLRRRVTYPPTGGGGTNTGLAVAKLGEYGFSAGIFAPAWSYEHFPTHGRDVERAVWEGCTLPDSLSCSCGDEDVHRTPDYQSNPVTRYARQYPAGTERLFHTSFREAFRTVNARPGLSSGADGVRSQLGSQEPLPLLESHSAPSTGDVAGEEEGAAFDARIGREGALEIFARPANVPEHHAAVLTLFHLNMIADGTLSCLVSLRVNAAEQTTTGLQLWLAYSHGGVGVPLNEAETFNHSAFNHVERVVRCPCRNPTDDCRLVGMQLRASKSPAKSVPDEPLLVVEGIRVAPAPSEETLPVEICSLRLVQAGHGDERHWRLKWDWKVTDEHSQQGNPDRVVSAPTTRMCGPFVRFAVSLADEVLNDAFACELVVPEKWWTRTEQGESLRVVVRGFDMVGRSLAQTTATLQGSKPHAEDWEVVDR